MTPWGEKAIEHVARAIYGPGWRDEAALFPEDIEGCLQCARAAILAFTASLKEPSEELLYECGNIANPEYGRIITTAKNLKAILRAILTEADAEVR